MLPPRAQSFVGRDEDLAWLHQQLAGKPGMILALCGPGGIGKTALAAEALSRFSDQDRWSQSFPDSLFYYSFYGNPSLDVAFEELVRVFGEEPGGDPLLSAKRAMSRRQALLVFDGVETLEDSRPLRTLGGKNTILLLSRRRSDAPDATHRRDLGLLPLDQSLTLLYELAGPRASNEVASKRLLTSIGGYPLALQLIGGYLSSQEEEIADYLHWFEHAGLTAIDFGKHQDQSVKFLLQHTYDALTLQEQHLFLTLGFLAPAPFPLELVRDILERPEPEIRRALEALINVCLLRRPGQEYEVSHPLVHTFAKESLSSQEKHAPSPSPTTITTWQERFLNALDLHFRQSNPFNVPILTLWLPHVLPWLSKDELTTAQSLQVAQVFNGTGIDAFTQGKYVEAEPLYQRALAIREQQLGADHPNTATSLNNLALLYRHQGKYVEAEPLYQRALAIWEQHLGPQHPDTATSLNNLADLYRDQGKYVKAEPLYQRALTIREQHLGPQHPDTAQSLNNLAELYRAQGKYPEAEPLLKRALTIFTQQVGREHPNTQQVRSNYHTLLADIHPGGDGEALLEILRQENPDSDT